MGDPKVEAFVEGVTADAAGTIAVAALVLGWRAIFTTIASQRRTI